ncbi:hypothetical protein BJX96DRAFT_171511 [Aspergillus floccosus]
MNRPACGFIYSTTSYQLDSSSTKPIARSKKKVKRCPYPSPTPTPRRAPRLSSSSNTSTALNGATPSVREAFHALCTGDDHAGPVPSVVELPTHPRPVRKRTGLPVSADVCLMVDGEVLRAVSQDLRNEYGEAPFVKAVERLPCLGPEYDGWFKVALTYLWRLVAQADNSGGLDRFLPPKRRSHRRAAYL